MALKKSLYIVGIVLATSIVVFQWLSIPLGVYLCAVALIIFLAFQWRLNSEDADEILSVQAATVESDNEHPKLISQIISMAEAEFILANDELEKIATIVAQAGKSLAGNFTGLQGESLNQQEIISALVKNSATWFMTKKISVDKPMTIQKKVMISIKECSTPFKRLSHRAMHLKSSLSACLIK